MKIVFHNCIAVLQIQESLVRIHEEAPHLLSPALAEVLQFMMENREYFGNLCVEMTDDNIDDTLRVRFPVQTAARMIQYHDEVWSKMLKTVEDEELLSRDMYEGKDFHIFFMKLKHLVKDSKWKSALIRVDFEDDD